jgi:2'-5' RNA ligase
VEKNVNTKRLFIAIDIDESIRNDLKNEVYKKEHLGHLSWVRPENYHLTLKFLGDVPTSDIDKIAGILEKSTRGRGDTTLTYTTLGVFPSPSRPRVIWVGFKESSDTLKRIANEIDEGLFSELGMQKENRPFTPHLTIARVKKHINKHRLAEFLKKGVDFKKNSFDVKNIVLYESELKQSGAEYRRIKEAALT